MPSLQLRLVGGFLGSAVLALLTQATYMNHQLVSLSHELPLDGEFLAEATPNLFLRAPGFSALVPLPATILVGVQLTFRTAGPIYRFERYLEEVATGADPGPVKIRKGDDLWSLCHPVNAALAEARRQARSEAQSESSDSGLDRAA